MNYSFTQFLKPELIAWLMLVFISLILSFNHHWRHQSFPRPAAAARATPTIESIKSRHANYQLLYRSIVRYVHAPSLLIFTQLLSHCDKNHFTMTSAVWVGHNSWTYAKSRGCCAWFDSRSVFWILRFERTAVYDILLEAR